MLSKLHLGLLPACAALLAAGSVVSVLAQEESTIDIVAVDAITDGNGATTLGPLDGCVEVELGDEFDLDVVVDAVPEDRPLIGFEYNITYDEELLEVTVVDFDYLLGAEGTFQPFPGLTDETPDTDGTFLVSVLDAASDVRTDEHMETGPGVLTRITFRALDSGSSEVGVSFIPPNRAYPVILSTDNEPTQVDAIGAVTVAAGEACPADAEPLIEDLPPISDLVPTPAPTIDPSTLPEPEVDQVNESLLIIAGAVGLVGAGGVAGGLVLYRRSRR